MTTIVLVRHGETDWNRENRFQGHADPPLNQVGREQAAALATSLRGDGVSAVYTSPLRRARETAEIIGEAIGVVARTDPRLMEVDVGSWSGLTREEIADRFPDGFARWLDGRHGWEGGETYEQLAERVLAALHEIATTHTGQTVVVVGHGGTVRTTLTHVDNRDVVSHREVVGPAANCAAYRLALRDGRLVRVD